MLYKKEDLKDLGITKLKEIARTNGIKGFTKYKSGDRMDLVDLIVKGNPSPKKISKRSAASKSRSKKSSASRRSKRKAPAPTLSPLSSRHTEFLKQFNMSKLRDDLKKIKVSRLRELLEESGCDPVQLRASYITKDNLITMLVKKINECEGRMKPGTVRPPTSPEIRRTPTTPHFGKMTKAELRDRASEMGMKNLLSNLSKDQLVDFVSNTKECDISGGKYCDPPFACDTRSSLCVDPKYVNKSGVRLEKVNGRDVLTNKKYTNKGPSPKEQDGIPLDEILNRISDDESLDNSPPIVLDLKEQQRRLEEERILEEGRRLEEVRKLEEQRRKIDEEEKEELRAALKRLEEEKRILEEKQRDALKRLEEERIRKLEEERIRNQRRLEEELEQQKRAAKQREELLRRAAEEQERLEQQKRLDEQQRAAAEQRRILDEQQRAAAEQRRILEEQQRAAAEQRRILEEQQRAAAEQRRILEEQQKAKIGRPVDRPRLEDALPDLKPGATAYDYLNHRNRVLACLGLM